MSMEAKQFQEAPWIIFLKAILLAFASAGFLMNLTGINGMLITALVTAVSAVVAPILMRQRIKLLWVIVSSAASAILLITLSSLIIQKIGTGDFYSTESLSQTLMFCGIFGSLVFLTRSFAQKWRWVQVLEMALVIGTVVFLFFAHRDYNINYPRKFTDWAYSNSYDPISIMRSIGAVVALAAMLMLLRRSRFFKVIWSYLFIIIVALLLFNFGVGDFKIPTEDIEETDSNANNSDDKKDDGGSDSNDDKDDNSNGGGSSNNDKNDNKGGGGGNSNSQMPNPNNKPVPVAIAVFFNEFEPADGYFHFRQSALSKYDGNHLVASDFDDDLILKYPYPSEEPIVSASTQNPDMHTDVLTKMYLLQDHPTPPQLSHAYEVSFEPNPDPKLFVNSYSVKSHGGNLGELRFLGHHSIPMEWSQEKRDHYLAIPDDPRYKALSDIIVRDVDPKFAHDDIAKAIVIRSWIEKNGFYTRKVKHIDDNDPTASFLFDSLRGYCVHFAHATVYLLRSQGIAARVALGYLVDNRLRGINSAVLILGDQAHAWPEIYIDGVGWVTFDVAPEQSDEEPRPFVDQDLETMFGELARGDKSAGKAETPQKWSITIPWKIIGYVLLWAFIAFIILNYLIKAIRMTMGHFVKDRKQIRWVTVSVLEFFSMLMLIRKIGETPEQFAQRLFGNASDFEKIVHLQERVTYGGTSAGNELAQARALMKPARVAAVKQTKWWIIALGLLNPISWWFSRCIRWPDRTKGEKSQQPENRLPTKRHAKKALPDRTSA